ncbi:hypothetical protein BGW37DRAFT_528730 [Umbelopsis sp. PMI_123]|nr:hypothetical protein BGW37DRAFT_528730 [Umbelopsis sp. PMI_123]
MTLNQPVRLDDSIAEQILENIQWRLGITPSGKPARYPCFVLSAIPEIITIHQQPHRSFIVTQSDWTANLVSSCVVSNTFEYTTLQALSDCQLLFENYSSINTERKTLHLLQLDAKAWFSTANILRPTTKLRQQLESALQLWPKDESRAWVALQRVWSDFGYFWPRKIQLGHRFHVPWPFKVPYDQPDKLYPLRLAKDEASTRIEYTINSGYQEISDEWTAAQPQRWTIIKRDDLEPIHNFLPAILRDRIVDIVKRKASRILVYQPFKLRNCYTEGYLSWRILQNRSTDPPVIRFASIPKEKISHGKHGVLWRFVWSADHSRMASPTLDMNNIKKITDKHSIKGGSQVYLQPAVMTTTSSGIQLPTNRLVLSRILNDGQPSIVGGVELIDPVMSMDIPIAEGEEDPRRWTLELSGLDLASTDEDLNIDIKLLKMKPIQKNEFLTLRQVLYLCSEPNGAEAPIVVGNGLPVRRNSQKARKSGPWQDGSPNSELCTVIAKQLDMIKNPLEMTWIIEPVEGETLTVTPKASTVPRVLSKRGARHSKSTPNLRIATGGHSASVPNLSTSNDNSKAQSFEDLLQTAVEQTVVQNEHSNHFSDSEEEEDAVDKDDRSGYAAAKLSVREFKEGPYKDFLIKERKRKTWSNMIRNSSLKKLSTLIIPPAANKHN